MSYGDPAPEQEEPAGPGTAGDTLGGDEPPTSNDGTMGADAPAGDAGLVDESEGPMTS